MDAQPAPVQGAQPAHKRARESLRQLPKDQGADESGFRYSEAERGVLVHCVLKVLTITEAHILRRGGDFPTGKGACKRLAAAYASARAEVHRFREVAAKVRNLQEQLHMMNAANPSQDGLDSGDDPAAGPADAPSGSDSSDFDDQLEAQAQNSIGDAWAAELRALPEGDAAAPPDAAAKPTLRAQSLSCQDVGLHMMQHLLLYLSLPLRMRWLALLRCHEMWCPHHQDRAYALTEEGTLLPLLYLKAPCLAFWESRDTAPGSSRCSLDPCTSTANRHPCAW